MRRRKVTPEVVIKSLAVFLFSAAVSFGSYHLTGLVVNRTAFATDEREKPFPKTIEPINEYRNYINKFEKLIRPEETELKNFFM